MNKKRLAVGLGIGIVAFAAWFYVFYVVSPEAAIARAEAFAFRRMTVARVEDGQGYRFHYVTNRAALDPSETTDPPFGTDRGDGLSFGYFDTTIEPSLRIGMLLERTDWFQNEEIRLKQRVATDQEEFVERMKRLVDESPNRSMLVVVHGYREAFDSGLRKTAFLSHVLDINAPVLVFDWPGNQGGSLAGYRRAREVAKASGADLAETLEIIVRDIQPSNLWLIANSMGAQTVANAFGHLYEDETFSDAQTELQHVVLTAPDVDRDEFDERFEHEITALSERLTVYVSSNDRALLVSRLINRGARSGESTASPDQFYEAAEFARLIQPADDRITLVDVTPVNRTRNFHNFILETPEFFDDLYLRLNDSSHPRTRLLYQVVTPEGRRYWVLTRGR